MSIFDSEAFNRALFFPERRTSPPPPGAVDLTIGGVHVRRHAAPDAHVTVLLFHGNGEVVADYDSTAPRFAELGAALAVADYRGYGQSEGTPTLRAAIEDARPIALELAGPVVVMGRSLGGAAAHELYANPTPNIVGIVLESAFSDLAGLIRRRGLELPRLSEEDRAIFDLTPGVTGRWFIVGAAHTTDFGDIRMTPKGNTRRCFNRKFNVVVMQ